MAKRFTESSKWQDSWFRKLKSEHKLFWIFILDNCDNAGLWEYDLELASFYVDAELNEKEINEIFKGRVVLINGKWFIPKFIEFQYGKLNENSKPHLSVINKLKKYDLIDENNEIIIPLIKGMGKGIHTLKDKDMVDEENKVIEKDSKKEKATYTIKEIDYEKLWEAYPKKLGRKDAMRHMHATIKTEQDYMNCKTAIKNYLDYIKTEKIQEKYIKNGSTFFNNWQDFINFNVSANFQTQTDYANVGNTI